MSTHVVFLDFSKAFDKVPPQETAFKSGSYWYQRPIVEVDGGLPIESATCKDSFSDWSNDFSGVPQRSILGPLLFLLYVNNINNDLMSTTRLFADDCAIFHEIGSNADCIPLQNDLSKLHRWTQKWQLPLNTSKCKVMCISNKRRPLQYSYSVNNIALEWVDTFSYLGIKIDRKLKWGDHTEDINRAKKRAYSALV